MNDFTGRTLVSIYSKRFDAATTIEEKRAAAQDLIEDLPPLIESLLASDEPNAWDQAVWLEGIKEQLLEFVRWEG